MVCSRGAASPDAAYPAPTVCSSAGYCQNPGCANELFSTRPVKRFTLLKWRMSFAATDGGPRTKPELSKHERGAFENGWFSARIATPWWIRRPDAFSDSVISLDGSASTQQNFEASSAHFSSKTAPLPARLWSLFDREPLSSGKVWASRRSGSNPESGAAERWKEDAHPHPAQ